MCPPLGQGIHIVTKWVISTLLSVLIMNLDDLIAFKRALLCPLYLSNKTMYEILKAPKTVTVRNVRTAVLTCVPRTLPSPSQAPPSPPARLWSQEE